ncbi:MAG: endonuclease III [SAR86 cluster bacterium]|uniref:Endonuclease III n=1 Tax=SAR86 cluster bacterium TaxID=2030880 RepID=A0A937LMW4_9GAMM|nr:endonuclease III [SAR86 cluster bacterium]
MKKSEKFREITRILDANFPHPEVPLDHDNAYTLLIAVLLSAQCTDERVNQITPQLFNAAKTPEKMMLLNESEIYKIIKPCGLGPQKSKAIKRLSQILVEKYDGEVPQSIEDLEQLPGVGHKTASVVISQAFGVPAFPVDTHIHRCAQRWGLTNGKNVQQTEKDLKKFFPEEDWNKLHIQIIMYARSFCAARSCFSLECEICKACNPSRKRKFVHKKP